MEAPVASLKLPTPELIPAISPQFPKKIIKKKASEQEDLSFHHQDSIVDALLNMDSFNDPTPFHKVESKRLQFLLRDCHVSYDQSQNDFFVPKTRDNSQIASLLYPESRKNWSALPTRNRTVTPPIKLAKESKLKIINRPEPSYSAILKPKPISEEVILGDSLGQLSKSVQPSSTKKLAPSVKKKETEVMVVKHDRLVKAKLVHKSINQPFQQLAIIANDVHALVQKAAKTDIFPPGTKTVGHLKKAASPHRPHIFTNQLFQGKVKRVVYDTLDEIKRNVNPNNILKASAGQVKENSPKESKSKSLPKTLDNLPSLDRSTQGENHSTRRNKTFKLKNDMDVILDAMPFIGPSSPEIKRGFFLRKK